MNYHEWYQAVKAIFFLEYHIVRCFKLEYIEYMRRNKKERADILLFRRGYCESREQARRLILAGKVRIGSDHIVQKASELLNPEAELFLDKPEPFVSRGAYKLMPALDKFIPVFTGLTALDVGASTGGFTDLMLQRGAKKVYAVDVGKNQLHPKLRNDPRVVCFEKVNARRLKESFLPEKVDILTTDVSFISVTKILPAVSIFLKPSGLAFVLIKPQFEAEKNEVGKGGVVRDEETRRKCVDKVVKFANEKLNWNVLEIIPSPILGPKGNQEYVAVFSAC